MKILDVTYTPTGRDSSRHQIGTVTISFSDGQVAAFDDVRRDSFEWWGEGGFDPRHVPYEMKFAFHPWLGRWKGYEVGEEIPNSEPMHEHGHIHEDDYLGQATGFPTLGFEPEEDD